MSGRHAPRGPVLLFREARDACAGMARLRELKGLTRPELAGLLGEQGPWVQARERLSTRMTRAEAERVAAALGTDYPGLLAAGATQLNESRAGN